MLKTLLAALRPGLLAERAVAAPPPPPGAGLVNVGKIDSASRLSRPLFGAGVPAGFPSPAENYLEKPLDLNVYLIKNPPATFFIRVTGDSMIEAGIHDGDILVVDRSLPPTSGSVVIAVLDGELAVKRLIRHGNSILLAPENPHYSALKIHEESQLQIWGVAVCSIHHL